MDDKGELPQVIAARIANRANSEMEQKQKIHEVKSDVINQLEKAAQIPKLQQALPSAVAQPIG